MGLARRLKELEDRDAAEAAEEIERILEAAPDVELARIPFHYSAGRLAEANAAFAATGVTEELIERAGQWLTRTAIDNAVLTEPRRSAIRHELRKLKQEERS